MNSDAVLLRKKWMEYLSISKDSVKEKGEALDRFLNVFLHLQEKNESKKCPEFDDLTSCGNIMTNQFLNDVHQVCTDIQNEDDTPLVHYLLEGRGWKILWLIKSIGVETLSSNADLVRLLLSFFSLCDKLYLYSLTQNKSLNLSSHPFYGIESCFQEIENMKNPSPQKKRRNRFMKKYSSASSDSDNYIELNRHMRKDQRAEAKIHHVIASSIPWIYFSTPGVKSSDEFETRYVTSLMGEIDMDKLDEKSMNCMDFCELIIDLLCKISLEDNSVRHHSLRSSLISADILSYSLNMFESLNETQITGKWSPPIIFWLKQQLLRLIFVPAVALACTQDGIYTIKKLELYQRLLITAADQRLYWGADDNTENTISPEESVLLCLNIVSGCITLLSIICSQCLANQDYLDVTNFIHFSEYQRAIITSCVIAYESLNTDDSNRLEKIESLVNVLTCTLISLKRKRLASWHSKECNKLRHKRCTIRGDEHHHRDKSHQLCCVADIINLLLEMFRSSKDSNLQNVILKSLKKSGLCCCLYVDEVLNNLLQCVCHCSVLTVRALFNFVETVVCNQLISNIEYRFCEVCAHMTDRQSTKLYDLLRNVKKEDVLKEESFNVPSVLTETTKSYRALLKSTDSALLNEVQRHLLHVCLCENQLICNELFINVVCLVYFEDQSSNLIKWCLTAFAILLKHPVLSEIFLKLDGLQLIAQHLNEITQRPLVLSILRILVASEAHSLSDISSVGNSISVQTFEKIIFDNCTEVILENNENDDHEMEFQLNLWMTCMSLIHLCKNYFREGVISLISHSFLMKLLKIIKIKFTVAENTHSKNGEIRRSLKNALKMLEAILSVCLRITPYTVDETDELIDSSKVAAIIEQQLEFCIGEWPAKAVKLLLQTLLNAAQESSLKMKMNSETHYVQAFFFETDEAEISDEFLHPETCYNILEDDGYEADLEVTDKLKENKRYKISSDNQIIYPEITNCVLNFMIKFGKFQQEVSCDRKGIRALTSVISRLIVLCRDNKNNCFLLYHQEILKIILYHFKKFFVNSSSLSELQNNLLELFAIIGQHSITSTEFSWFINLFKIEDPPLERLLNALSELISTSCLQPDCEFSFPTYREDNSIFEEKIEAINSETFGGEASEESNLLLDVKITRKIQRIHSIEKMSSPWSKFACILPVQDSPNTTLSSTFSISLWMKMMAESKLYFNNEAFIRKRRRNFNSSPDYTNFIDSSTDMFASLLSDNEEFFQSHILRNQALHIVSVGHHSMLFEIWSLPAFESFVLRIATNENSNYRILFEKVCKSVLQLNQWHHMTINYTANEREPFAQVEVIVDGQLVTTVTEITLHSTLAKVSPVKFLLVGHVSEDVGHNSWYLASLIFMTDISLNCKQNLAMYALGPNGTNFLESLTDQDDVCLPPQLAGKLLKLGLNAAILQEVLKVKLSALQEKISLVYTPHNCYFCIWYSKSTRTGNGVLKQLSSPSLNCSAVPVQVEQKLEIISHNSVGTAITQLGGISVLLLLLCRVIECSLDEEIQSNALGIVLRFAGSGSKQRREFIDIGGSSLLVRLFFSPRFCAKYQTLMVIVNSCLSSPILSIEHSGKVVLITNSDAIVLDPDMLCKTFDLWKVWENENMDIYRKFMIVIERLINEKHPHHAFNTSQLYPCFITCLLTSFKERYIDERLMMPKDISLLLISIMRSLLFSPTKNDMLGSIFNFLILAHPAADKHLSDSENNFYFLLNPAKINSVFLTFSPPFMDDSKLNDMSYASQEIDANSKIESVEYAGKDTPELPQEKVLSRKNISSVDKHVSKYWPKKGERQEFYEDYEIIPEIQTSPSPEILSGPESSSPNEWEVVTVDSDEINNDNLNDDQNNMTILCAALLTLLVEVVDVLPENICKDVCSEVIIPEQLLVLANSPDNNIRTAVVKLLQSYLRHTTIDEQKSFLKMKGFIVLANQVRRHSSTEKLVEASISLVLDRNFSFERSISEKLKVQGEVQQASTALLLALVPTSVGDTALCHNLLNFIHQLLGENPEIFHILLENALLEVLMQIITNILHSSERETDLIGVHEQEILCNDIKQVLEQTSLTAVRLPNGVHFPVLLDLLVLLSYIEKKELRRQGVKAIATVQRVREFQCCCLQIALDFYYQCLTVGNTNEFHIRTTVEQLQQILVKSVDFLIHLEIVEGQANVGIHEKRFTRYLTQILLSSFNAEKDKIQEKTSNSGLWSIRSAIQLQLMSLFVFLLDPCQSVEQRLFVVTSMMKEENPYAILNRILKTNTKLAEKFYYYLRIFFNSKDEQITMQDRKMIKNLLALVDSYNIVTPSLSESLIIQLKHLWAQDVTKRKQNWLKQNEIREKKLFSKYDYVIQTVGENIRAVTRGILHAQHSAYKEFIAAGKSSDIEKLKIRLTWKHLIHQLTHEKAVWHFPESYPQSWQLQNVESLNNERRRLQRCHLRLPKRFLLKEHQAKLAAEEKEQPFQFLLEDIDLNFRYNDRCAAQFVADGDEDLNLRGIELHNANENIRFSSSCSLNTPSCDIFGEVLVGETCIYFIGKNLKSFSVNDRLEDYSSQKWMYEDIKEVLKRLYDFQQTALEVFLNNGQVYFLNFKTEKERDSIYDCIISNPLTSLVKTPDLLLLTRQWQDREITNFEYLMQINKIAGRTFNDLMQYPVFPFILNNYTSSSLNLLSAGNFRNLSKPMAIQDKNKEQHFIDVFEYWKNEKLKQQSTVDALLPVIEPYHYGSHYSNSMTVLYFLVRLPPYTGVFLKYQDCSFDIPDRSFHSLEVSWRLSSKDSNTDMKELIPEFFFLPEFFFNSEGFNMGIRQNAERVDHVVLPPWCKNSPRRFVLIHRQALESDYVTEHLSDWIDLIFGYKQTGKAAIKAINVFHPATYQCLSTAPIKDPLHIAAIETMTKSYGQTPKQLFQSPHPRASNVKAQNDKIFSVPEIQGLKWGNYVGSPTCDKPKIILRTHPKPSVASFLATVKDSVIGLAKNCAVILNSSRRNNLNSQHTAIITWDHPDGNVRAKMRGDQSYVLIRETLSDPVCTCTAASDRSLLLIGHQSGIIAAYFLRFDTAKNYVKMIKQPIRLYGHTFSIIGLHTCSVFGVFVSISSDGSCIVWDLTTLNYIRRIKTKLPVKLAAISKVTGDIAIVSDTDSVSVLRLCSINCKLAASTVCSESIHSVCFSCAPEGISINVIATGSKAGQIWLWSTWDLTVVSVIEAENFNRPVTSLTFSTDCQFLYATNSDGELIIWHNGSKSLPKYTLLY